MCSICFVDTMNSAIISFIFATSSAWSQVIADLKPSSCGKEQWKCRDGTCISIDDICDGVRSCPDGSDETFTLCRKVQCQANWFRCAYGACADGPAPCDNVQDCADNSDELLRRCRNQTEEVRGIFKCGDSREIAAYFHCDGIRDCTDGSDEILEECAGKTCASDMFQCAYGACVQLGSDCDDKEDCADGSDESDELCNSLGPITSVTTSNVSKPECGHLPDIPDVIPWNVAIYSRKTRPYRHICGGTLISNNIVISAAHCFWDQAKKSPASIEDYAVAVGKQTRPWDTTRDPHAQTSEIKKIKLDPHFRGAATNFQSDIAVLVLTSPVELNAYVSHACIDFDKAFEKYQLKSGNKGKVTGWGQIKKGDSLQLAPTVLDVPVLDIEQCLQEAPASFTPYIAIEKICLGDKKGTGISRGFGGSGVTFESTDRGVSRHYLRGVISSAPGIEEEFATTTSPIVTVTQLSKYESLIKNVSGN